MFSLFKRKSAVTAESTFKNRVERFWTWYAGVAPRFYKTIEAGKCPSLAGEVSAKVDELVPGFAWVFGPGVDGKGHSFTLSGEGNIHRQLLTLHWLAQAPALPGWTFYAARQPGSIRGTCIETGGRKFDPMEFWITPVPNLDNEKVDITVWHPLFGSLPERDRYQILFLFLDEVLGEYGTEQWIGEIKLNHEHLANSIPLEELSDFLKRLQAEQGWKKYPPGDCVVLYRLQDPHNRFLRGDIVTGTTSNRRLIDEYLQAEGDLEDPLQGTGADYVFVAFDVKFLAAGSEVATRGKIEDALHEALQSAGSGRSLGGALGRENAYIDLLLVDGLASIAIILQALQEQGLPAGSSINYFAKEKRGHRVVI